MSARAGKATPRRAIVVGAGIMGLSTAWALARQGSAVTVIEQDAIPNPRGSSVDQHRLIRHPYGASRGYTRMIADAERAWDLMWRDIGDALFVRTGTLALTASEGGWLADSIETMAAEKIAFRRLDAAALAGEFALIASDDVRLALRLDSGGILLAAPIIARLARHLAARGVTLRANAKVAGIDPEAGQVTLAGGETLAADMVVAAAGPWTNALLPGMAARMQPSRQVVVYLVPPPDLAAAWQRMPMVLDINPATGLYVVPPRGAAALKIGDHSSARAGDPDGERVARPEEIARVLAAARARIRRLDEYRAAFAKVCFYDVSADERFIVAPAGRRCWAMTGFSGHGFKFGAALGLRLAATIAGRHAPADTTRWATGEI